MNKQQQEIDGKLWKAGDDSPLGVITEFFTADGQICFFTESGAFYPARYLIGC